jgi:hypothetical protein
MAKFDMSRLRQCDPLEGASDFTCWKCKLEMWMEEYPYSFEEENAK